MRRRRTRIVVTLGPATEGAAALAALRARGVDFVRTNMSHSSLADLERAMAAARRAGLPFIIDTEGSQVRSGDLVEQVVRFEENDELRLWSGPEPGHRGGLQLKPPGFLPQLEEGDLLHVDFDTLVLRVTDASTAAEGYVTARAVAGGWVGRNKAVVVDPIAPRPLLLPALSEKDLESIRIGLREGVEHIAVSFVRSGAAVDQVRAATQGRMAIISKIECADALERLSEIIERSDMLLIDRGDLSKEIALERIPFVQKLVIHEAAARGKDVFVATNFLETMVEKRNPTRAEVQDVVNTVLDGAAGLTLAAETAIGRFPIECVTMLDRLIEHAERVAPGTPVAQLADSGYLGATDPWPSLPPPHGGRLVNRVVPAPPDDVLATLPVLRLDADRQGAVELIANGTFSPLEGFLGPEDLESVLANMTLADGTIWPLPVVLEVDERQAAALPSRGTIGLADERGSVFASMDLERVYPAPSAAAGAVLLAGRIGLFGRRHRPTRQYELSPRQTRTLFQARSWRRILGDWWDGADGQRAPRQRRAFDDASCDGLFVQALLGAGGSADLLRECERQTRAVNGRDTLLLAALPAMPFQALRSGLRPHTRSGGTKADSGSSAPFGPPGRHSLCRAPRPIHRPLRMEPLGRYAWTHVAMVLGAVCRLNFGCTHAIVGADVEPGALDQLAALPVELIHEPQWEVAPGAISLCPSLTASVAKEMAPGA